MSGFLEVAAGLVGGLGQGLEKRAERERLERERLDRLEQFNQQLSLEAERVELQRQVNEIRQREEERNQKEFPLRLNRLQQQLDLGGPVEIEVTNPTTGETETREVSREQLMNMNAEDALRFNHFLPIETSSGTALVAPEEAVRIEQENARLEQEENQRFQEAQLRSFESLLRTTEGQFGGPLLFNPEARALTSQMVNDVFGRGPKRSDLQDIIDRARFSLGTQEGSGARALRLFGNQNEPALPNVGVTGLPDSSSATLTPEILQEAATGRSSFGFERGAPGIRGSEGDRSFFGSLLPGLDFNLPGEGGPILQRAAQDELREIRKRSFR